METHSRTILLVALHNDAITQAELSSILDAMFLAYERQSRNVLDEDEGIALVSMVSNTLARDLTGLNETRGKNGRAEAAQSRKSVQIVNTSSASLR